MLELIFISSTKLTWRSIFFACIFQESFPWEHWCAPPEFVSIRTILTSNARSRWLRGELCKSVWKNNVSRIIKWLKTRDTNERRPESITFSSRGMTASNFYELGSEWNARAETNCAGLVRIRWRGECDIFTWCSLDSCLLHSHPNPAMSAHCTATLVGSGVVVLEQGYILVHFIGILVYICSVFTTISHLLMHKPRALLLQLGYQRRIDSLPLHQLHRHSVIIFDLPQIINTIMKRQKHHNPGQAIRCHLEISPRAFHQMRWVSDLNGCMRASNFKIWIHSLEEVSITPCTVIDHWGRLPAVNHRKWIN